MNSKQFKTISECVTTARNTITTRVLKVYHMVTAYLPRKMPTTYKEFDDLKHILTQYYGLKDEPAVWATVAGQVTSTKPTSLRKPYIFIANAARRLEVNRIAQEHKEFAFRQLQSKLKALEEKAKQEQTEDEGADPVN